MVRFHVGGKVVEAVDLLKRRHTAWRLDVLPFVFLYSIWLFLAVPSLEFTDALIILGGLAGFHILVLLFTAWSVDFKCFVRFSKVSEIRSADACKVIPAKFSGAKEIVPLHFQKPWEPSRLELIDDAMVDRYFSKVDDQGWEDLKLPTRQGPGIKLGSKL